MQAPPYPACPKADSEASAPLGLYRSPGSEDEQPIAVTAAVELEVHPLAGRRLIIGMIH